MGALLDLAKRGKHDHDESASEPQDRPQVSLRIETRDYTPADLQRMDALLSQLAELEGWDAATLADQLAERSRMAPVNVLAALAGLEKAVRDALATWPKQPQERSNVRLCYLVH